MDIDLGTKYWCLNQIMRPLVALIWMAASVPFAASAEYVVTEAVISPGNSPGCIESDGNITLLSTLTLVIEIGGSTPCTEFDRFIVAQALTIQGATLQVVLINSFVPPVGQTFDILDWGTLTGTFGTVDFAAATLGAGHFWDTSSLHTSGELSVSGPPAVATTTVPVPVWSLYAASGLLAGLGFVTQRRA